MWMNEVTLKKREVMHEVRRLVKRWRADEYLKPQMEHVVVELYWWDKYGAVFRVRDVRAPITPYQTDLVRYVFVRWYHAAKWIATDIARATNHVVVHLKINAVSEQNS